MKRLLSTAVAVVVAGTVLTAPAEVAAVPPDPVPPAAAPSHPDRIGDPDRELGNGWRGSNDLAVTTSSDETGLHLLTAAKRDAYRWRTVASLAEPGVDADQWIGQFCVTGSGRYAVVVYAPRQFANREETMDRGGFAAVVDLTSGAVTKLAERVTLAYYNPGCGAGDTAVVSSLENADALYRTRLSVVDPREPAPVTRTVTTPGQVTSALPVGDTIVAAKADAVVEVTADGVTHRRVSTGGSPFRLMPDGTTGVALQVSRGDDVDIARYANGVLSTVGTVPSGAVKLRPGSGGRVYAVGGRAAQRMSGRLPGGWRAMNAPPDSDVSTTGAMLVTRAVTGRERAGRVDLGRGDGAPDQVEIVAMLAGGKAATFGLWPDTAAPGGHLSPALGGTATMSTQAALAGNDTTPWDLDRACAVPRNDPTAQVYQPTPSQVEWAANLAVQGKLTFQRPANWTGSGLPAWSPQGMFPPLQLSGGGRVPAQVMLAILAQESNMWQASWHAVDGSAGNPLTSQGFYGLETGNPKLIDWSKVDCGYGAGQVTTGMRVADTGTVVNGVTMDYTKQKTVAVDYATNVSAALRLLQSKWNETYNAGVRANGGDPQYIENWWFAIWAYNTGFYAPQASDAPWGVGWANNPANPRFPADRKRFLTAPLDVPAQNGQPAYDDTIGYDNAKHPNHWSYPERVIGFAYTSLRRYDYTAGAWRSTYRTANTSDAAGNPKDPDSAQPGRFTFCEYGKNLCDPATSQVPGDHPTEPAGPCTRDDLKCWWHFPVSWTNCVANCGTEDLKYPNVEPRPYATNPYPSACTTTGLPSGVRVIDDIDYATPVGPEGCAANWTKGGSFALEFASMTNGAGQTIHPSKVDFHQIGGGFGGHFWWTHTATDVPNNQPIKVTGRWTVNNTNAWTRVFVHVPDHGAHTRQADYRIYGPNGAYLGHRAIPTRHEANTWLDIGVFDFRGSGSPRIELSSFTRDGNGTQDVAWDAIAVQPLAAKPKHFVVAMGDSYSSGEGAGFYSRVSDQYGDDPANRNACHRSSKAWSRQIVIPGTPSGSTVGALADARNAGLDYHFTACSGAVTANLMSTTAVGGGPAPANASGDNPRGQYGELSQIDQGFLDANTTLVVLTIGGNDAKWVQVLEACAYAEDCSAPGFTRDGDPRPLRDMIQERLTTKVSPDVDRTIAEIRRHAPNAWIVQAGYPYIFMPGSSYGLHLPNWPGGELTVGFSEAEVGFLTEMTNLAMSHLLKEDMPNRINGVDVRSDFYGHELGSNSGDGYLNPIFVPGDAIYDYADDDGEPSNSVKSPHSGHPNIAGNEAYGRALSDRLSVLGYTW